MENFHCLLARIFKNRNTLFIAAITIGVIFRVILLIMLPGSVSVVRIIHESDSVEYFGMAQNLLDGKGFSLNGEEPTAFRPPLYPLLIAMCRANLYLVLLLHLGCFVLTSWILWRIAFRVLQHQLWSSITVLVYALYFEHAIYDVMFLSENVFTLFFLGTIECLFIFRERPHFMTGSILSGVAALMALTRPIGLYIFLALLMVFIIAKIPNFHWNTLVFLCLSFLLFISPWFIRNYINFGRFVFVTNGGVNFYFGNLRDGTKGWASTPDDLRPTGNEVQMDETYRHEAIKLIKRRWKIIPIIWFRKSLRLWFNLGYGKEYNWTYPGVLVSCGRLVFFALLSAALRCWKTIDRFFFLLFFFLIVFFTGIHVLVYASPRFLVPLLPLITIMILAGFILNDSPNKVTF